MTGVLIRVNFFFFFKSKRAQIAPFDEKIGKDVSYWNI